MTTDGTVAGWNDVAAATFGWSWEEARGMPLSELIIPPKYREAHERGLAHYLATGEGAFLDRHIEIEAVRRSGEVLPVDLSITVADEFGERVFLGFLRDISERKAAERERELLLEELNHRVKNMLGVVAGIAEMSARTSPTVEAFQQAFQGRIGSLAHAHDLLLRSRWSDPSLANLVDSLLGPYREDARSGIERVSIAGPDLALSSRQLLSVSLLLHELLTNATKYGALSRDQGRIAVEWRIEPDVEGELRLAFVWHESGMDGISSPTTKGFGLTMMDLSARHQLRGSARWDFLPNGLRFELSFPVSRSTEP